MGIGQGIGYQRYDNSIIQVDNVKRAQEIAEQFVGVNFVKAFDALSRQINPVLPRIKKVFSKGYYWVLDQGEYATDVMFKDRQSLTEIYPELVEHALVNFTASDVMTFLGRKLTGNFQGEIITDTKKRPQGVRIKHRMKKNSLKMYDKWSVLTRLSQFAAKRGHFLVRIARKPLIFVGWIFKKPCSADLPS